MEAHLNELVAGINRWRSRNIAEYWLRADYIGNYLNRMGDHTFTYADGKFWHLWHEEWREIEKGKDFWLFSVPGAFAWARDLLTKVLPAIHAKPEMFTLQIDPEYGYIRFMEVKIATRDPNNFSFEVKGFGVGRHPDYK